MKRSNSLLGLAAFLAGQAATAATVFVQYPGGTGITVDPVLATQAGPGFAAEADLFGGGFKAESEAPDAGFAYAGLRDLVFTNTGAAPIVLGPGAISANVTAAYTLGPPTPSRTSTANATVIGVLSVTEGGVARVARGDHAVGIRWEDGAVFGTPTNTALTSNSNGGAVAFNTTTLSALDMTLLMPALTIDPGETIELEFLLQTIVGANGAGVKALADAFNSAYLSIDLPVGASLASNAGGPLTWVTPVPLPGTLPLMGTAFGAVAVRLYRLRRRRIPA